MKYLLLVLTLIALAAAPAVAGVPDDLQRVSVTIKSGRARNPAGGSDKPIVVKPPFDFNNAANRVERLFNRAVRRSS